MLLQKMIFPLLLLISGQASVGIAKTTQLKTSIPVSAVLPVAALPRTPLRTLASTKNRFSATANLQDQVAFVQLFEWPWADIARECEIFLGPTGYTAVLTSPPHEHIVGAPSQWWQRYQVVSYNLNSRSGDEKGFIDMVNRCHKAGVQVYTDAVINHMAGIDQGTGVGGTAFTHYNYPGLYGNDDFHHCGSPQDDIQDYTNLFQLQNCELVNLADLATEKASVQTKISGYMNHLLDLGVDGFRIDAAKHIAAVDIGQILGRLKRSVYIFQELIISPGEPLHYGDYTKNAAVTAYGYPYFLSTAFKQKNPQELNKIGSILPDSAHSVVFVDNHDLERDPNQAALLNSVNDAPLFALGQTFMMTWPFGYPEIFSGFFFNNRDEGPPVNAQFHTTAVLNAQGQCAQPWSCSHREPRLVALLRFRAKVPNSVPVADYWTNNKDQMGFSRGAQAYVMINSSSGNFAHTFRTSLPAGSYCDELSGNCGFVVDKNKNLNATVPALSAVVLLKK